MEFPDTKSQGKEAFILSFTSLSFLHSSNQPLQKQPAIKNSIPFGDVLSKKDWQEMLDQEGIQFRERVFSPLGTLWTFVCQILSQDHSCRSAVAQWVAVQVGRGKKPCSSLTTAYCRARRKLPETFYRRVTLRLGEKLSALSPEGWKWKGREVKIVDGSTLKLPDTPTNEAHYPQRRNQKKGLGFPTVRILTVVSLSCGALLDAAFSSIRGKETGEPALLRSLISSFKRGDVLLFDRYFSGYFNLAFLVHHGIDVVVRQHHMRNDYSMTQVKRFSDNDRIVALRRPFRRSFDWKQCPLEYDQFPPAMLLREVTFHVRRAGFRPRVFGVLTTMLNPAEYSCDDILRLYAARWNVETDLLNMKVALSMDSLRCKTPDMIRKEIWAHLMAYNFVRLVTAQAAEYSDQTPRSISFQGAVQSIQAFRPLLMCAPSQSQWLRLYSAMIQAVSRQRIGNRPGRYEPRVLKRRNANTYPFLTTTRSKARKKRLLNPKERNHQYAKFARS